jgi:hypothetical protein
MFTTARTFSTAVRTATTTTTTTTKSSRGALCVRAAAEDTWMPGSARPAYLNGSTPGYVSMRCDAMRDRDSTRARVRA